MVYYIKKGKLILKKIPPKDMIRGIRLESKQFETGQYTKAMSADIVKGRTEYPLPKIDRRYKLDIFIKNY